MPSCLQPIKYNGFLLSYPIFAAGQDLWYLRLVIKKAMKIWYCILPDYGLLTGLSIVTVHHGPERIHSVLLNILSSFPCRMYPMNHEGTGFSMSYMVCMRFTHSKDRQFLLRKSLTYNLIIVLYWILSQSILWTFYTPESYIYTLRVGIYTPKTEYSWSYL